MLKFFCRNLAWTECVTIRFLLKFYFKRYKSRSKWKFSKRISENLENMAAVIPFHHPTTILVAGPTFSGKTSFLKKIIRTRMVQPSPERIIWVYKEKDGNLEVGPIVQEFPNVQFYSELD